ncbi:hypothetical protein [Flavitalea sp.]|nr:hypothetical protein [Flavitalea sp.]
MKNNFDEIELKLIRTLNDFLREAKSHGVASIEPWNNKMWTRGLQEKICRLGLDEDYGVAPNIGIKAWLYDIVWYVEDSKNRLIKIPLIVECEWNLRYDEIQYDFEKLLVGNAERRLMICQCPRKGIEQLISNLVTAIDLFQENHGDKFLIAVLDSDTEDEFIFRTFTKPPLVKK